MRVNIASSPPDGSEVRSPSRGRIKSAGTQQKQACGRSRSRSTGARNAVEFMSESIADSVKKRRRGLQIDQPVQKLRKRREEQVEISAHDILPIPRIVIVDTDLSTKLYERGTAHDDNVVDDKLPVSEDPILGTPLQELKEVIRKDSHDQHRHRHHHHGRQRRNEFPIPFSDSRWLVVSSLFFIVPGIQAWNCHQPWYFVLSLVTSIISAVYWYDARLGLRHSLDWYFAKISFVIYFITGALYVTDPYLHAFGWPVCLIILWAFWMSGQEWKRDKSNWMYYHMAFHFFVAIEQSVVITGSFPQCHYSNFFLTRR